MRPLLRAVPMALIYAVLAGPADPANWLVGGALAFGLGLLMRSRRPALGPGQALGIAARALLLPWFLLGCLWRIASGVWTMIRLLAPGGRRAEFGFVRCRVDVETPTGAALLALVGSTSPDSIVTELDGGEMRSSLVPADEGERHCDEQRRWYRRFQQRMLP